MTDPADVDLSTMIQRATRHSMAPELIQKVANDDTQDDDAMAEVAAELTVELREMCVERDLSKHTGQAICYMIVDLLAEQGRDE